jgi:hypothetical protein
MMRQYEEKYPDFIFIGPVPRDCKIGGSLQCELTNFDINRAYDKGIRKIGIIYNNDYSYQSGSHWNCVLIDMKDKTIEFYDSYGSKPLPEVLEFMKKNAEKLNKRGMKVSLGYNNTRHQYDDYNCGMYSMYFLVKRLEGYKMEEIERMDITTKKMQNLKKVWYRD